MAILDTARRPAVLLPAVLSLLLPVLLAACGEGGQQDPQQFYGELVEAARRHDGGFMYDVLDSSRRAEVDTLIGMQMANLDKLPPSERGRWDSLKGKPMREVYGRILSTDEGVSALFRGDYKILRVDTLVTLTVQHAGQPVNVIYLRPKGDRYVVAKPPRPPGMPPPSMAPDQQQMPPATTPQPGPGKGNGANPAPGQKGQGSAPKAPSGK